MPPETNKPNREYSAGGIVYKKQNDQLLILLIRTSGTTAQERDNVWTFPKGHINEGESDEIAAIREVREESGVNAKIIQNLGKSQYSFISHKQKIDKMVSWYIMEYISGSIDDHDDEVAEVKWLDINEVSAQLIYQLDKDNLEKVKQFLETNV